ncbi:hypothetical protein VL14_13235 [Cytobacillus firmus]|nr:hypothetical protein VL14_13235 [Cytobacillus firmus]
MRISESKKSSYTFPVIFDYHLDGITVLFPDLPGVLTYGFNADHAYRNAQEALGLHIVGYEEEHEIIPEPSQLLSIQLSRHQALAVIHVSMPPIRARIRKNKFSF